MSVLHNVVIDYVTVSYGITVHTSGTPGGNVHEFIVRDDGWALMVKTKDGASVARIKLGDDRNPDKDSAQDALTDWARKRYER